MKDISEIVDTKRVEQNKPKLGDGHVSAMGRMGLKEIAQILQATPESISLVEEYGAAFTALPSEVAEQRKGSLVHGDTQLSTQPQKQLQPDMELEM